MTPLLRVPNEARVGGRLAGRVCPTRHSAELTYCRGKKKLPGAAHTEGVAAGRPPSSALGVEPGSSCPSTVPERASARLRAGAQAWDVHSGLFQKSARSLQPHAIPTVPTDALAPPGCGDFAAAATLNTSGEKLSLTCATL